MHAREILGSWSVVLLASVCLAGPFDSDRLPDHVGCDPYYVNLDFARLTTPQWVGEEGVEAVVVLAIDDLRDNIPKYEAVLRPILDRLKAIDGRAPLSIMTCHVDPRAPELQGWLAEGVSIEVHTLTHPCPLLQKGDLAEAARVVHGGVDLLSQVPGSRPVAFRMPCCDSLNTFSPRFVAEIFNKTSPGGHFLTIDSSVFNILTPADPSLPRNLVEDADGCERFRKYVPFPSFVNTIENYPYPYVIGRVCWEFPCVVPTDWSANHLHQPNNPKTVEDWKAALDAVVLKQGVFNLVFHPHGWIKSEQVVELIDHAVRKHGKKVKFLNFREAQERLDKNLLGGQPLRAANGQDNNVRLIDVDRDGFMDVVVANEHKQETRRWVPATKSWVTAALAEVKASPPGDDRPQAVFSRGEHDRPRLPFRLPEGARLADDQGRDAGLRFVDLDEDGFDDVVFSNDHGFGIYLFESMEKGWSRQVMSGKPGAPNALPRIVCGGTNNGFWVHSRHLWWQNEDTAKLPNLVDRRSFNDLLKDVEPRAKSAQASLRSIRVRPGFRVEQVAQEPLVKDPIAFDWGADGKLWVLEMGDYPLGSNGKGQPGGVVRVLEDTNGDGRYVKSTVFLDGLSIPSGLIPWRNGVLVACAPDIFYAEDRDGDGKADTREVLFTGFQPGNPQHRVNGFDLGLDGWIYGANGDSGGAIRSIKTGATVDISGRDFRFRPDDGRFEAESGPTQYGRHRDDWGHWFGNANPIWAWHYVLADPDLRRNPQFALPDPRQMLEPDTKLYPVSRTLARFNDENNANRTTSANSPTPYRDDLFGSHFEGSLFVSEPVHNLVHRMILDPEGPSYKGRRAPDESDREFFASSDNWTRPTMLRTGPDGALWIADMYRAVIEHPEWIPDDWEARLDLRAGSEQGRIYRVFPVDQTPRPIPRLDRLDTKGLVAALDSPSGWQRDTAQRLLLHRRDSAAVEPLRELVATTRHPKTRVQALWTLECLNALTAESIVAALGDVHPQVRRNAIQAGAGLLKQGSPALIEAMLRRTEDADTQVRFQLALALGDCDDPRAGPALARLVRHDPADAWLRAAVLSSATPHAVAILTALFAEPSGDPPPGAIVEPLFVLAGTLKDRSGLASLIATVGSPAGQGGRFARWQFSALAGLLDAAERTRHPLADAEDRQLDRLRSAARELARDASIGDDDRVSALALLGREPAKRDADRALLAGLLRPQVSSRLQQAAVSALGRVADEKVPETMLAGWKGHAPALRDAIIDTLLSREAWTAALLSTLESGGVTIAEVGPATRRRLLDQRDPTLKRRAEALVNRQGGSRTAVIDSYRPALTMQGDPKAGASAFKKICASCHRLGNEGTAVGPDLASLTDKSPESLLIAILDPNRAFEAKYTNFAVQTKDGRVLSGMIANETANAVTLVRQEGKNDVLLRADIEEMASSRQSLMPEGVEKDLSPHDLADLIAFLNAPSPPPRAP